MNQSELILALDAGTSSTRVLAFDFDGKAAHAIAQRSYSQTTTPDGGVFTNADALLELTAQCLDETLKSVADAPIAAVAMSCFWHSLVGVGENDQPRTPLFSWADNRAAPCVKTLRERLDEDAAHARTGCVFHASFWPAKLLWLHETQPELFDGKTRWLSFGEYLALKWCGAARVSLSMASGTGLFNQNACDWDDETLSILPISRADLSPLCDAADALNAPLPDTASTRAVKTAGAHATKNLNENSAFAVNASTHSGIPKGAAAARWPQLQRARWFPALGDGACSNIGSGCTDVADAKKRGDKKTRIALNVGTSGALRVVLRDFSGAPPRGLFRYRLDQRRSVVGGALSNGGNVLMWARQNLALPNDAEAHLAAMAPDAHGLTVLPFLAGERSPNWNDAARFALNGATLDTTSTEIYRAALEGASLRFLRVLRLLQAALQNKDGAASTRDKSDIEIVVSGGALAYSEAWARIMTDCLGAPLLESKETQASARGAALMALEALGAIEDIRDLPTELGDFLAPDLAYHALYLQALQRQDEFSEKLLAAT